MALAGLLLVSPLVLAGPQVVTESDLEVLIVDLPGHRDSVELVTHDPRIPDLAETAPSAADGLFTGVLRDSGWALHLVWTNDLALGVLAADSGAIWVTVDAGRLVPFIPTPHTMAAIPETLSPPLHAPAEEPMQESSVSTQDGVLQVMLDGDHMFHRQHLEGWREAQLAVIHLVDAIYQTNLGFPIEVVEQHVWTQEEQEPWEDERMLCGGGSTHLRHFRDYWEGTSPSVDSAREATHLFSGKTFNGNTIGCAYVGELDTSWAYGVSQVRGPLQLSNLHQQVTLVSHELGHNFNGIHELAFGVSCAGGTIMFDTLCANSPVFSGAESLALCKAGLPDCTLVVNGNAQRMWNYAEGRI